MRKSNICKNGHLKEGSNALLINRGTYIEIMCRQCNRDVAENNRRYRETLV
jgi:hypothetical protein